jgi:adenosylcobinamide-GDP ribazoletransferase
MLHELRLFLIALQFLTRVPVPAWAGWRPEWLQDSARHFPAVGLLVGSAGALVLWSSAHLWPATVAVGLSMVATVWMTGAFHEVGLAGTCDALGGPASRERALEIMKGSHTGRYGAIGLIAVLGLKGAALFGLALRDFEATALALPLAHAWSRAVPVLLMRLLPNADSPGPARAGPTAARASSASAAMVLSWCLIVGAAVALLGMPLPHLLVAALCVLAVLAAMARWLHLRLGGCTGDTLGASQQGAELVIYLALLAAVTHA